VSFDAYTHNKESKTLAEKNLSVQVYKDASTDRQTDFDQLLESERKFEKVKQDGKSEVI